MNNLSIKLCSLYFTEKKKMPRKCSIAFCKSVDGGTRKCTFFGVPKSSVDTWTEIVSKVNGYDTKVKFVCD